MTSERPPGQKPALPNETAELARLLADLREANERLVTAGVRMQELAEEAQQARSEAEAADRAKDEFLAALSHELRTPLNALLGWTHMLRQRQMTGASVDHALEIIERNARLQAQLISDLLQVSQIITGKLRLDLVAVDLAPIVRAGIEALCPAATAKGIGIESRIESGVRPILADASRVQQIVWNVLSNAVKFTPRGGQVTVTLTQAGSAADVAIADSGIGIEPHLLPHVFDRFRQGDGAPYRRFGGLGLGLSIVQQLMELHGGSVRAESRGAGFGSTFTLTFNVPASTADRAGAASRRSGAPSLQGLRVLVVEDESDSRDLMMALLSGNGAMVTAVTSAREAIGAFDSRPPDVLIADIGLPDENGYELMRQVRALETGRGRPVPAVALTAHARDRDHDEAMAAGFQLHLTKPLEPDTFVQNVAVLAQQFRNRGSVR